MAASVEEYQQALLQSCVNGDAASVETYVQQFQQYGVDMNFTTESGRNLVSETVIFAASNAQGRYFDVLQTLLQVAVISPDVQDSDGRTALHWAAYNGMNELLALLITAGGSVLVYDNDGLTPVHAALQHPLCVDTIIQLRIRSEPEILEVPTGDGLTPLMMAVHLGNYKVCQLLLDSGSDPNRTEDNTLKSALHLAAETGHGNIVELLLKYRCRLDANDSRGATPVHIAASLLQSNVLEVICDKVGNNVLDIQDSLGLTALMHSCSTGSEECVRYILKRKTNLLLKDSTEEKTCLHWAAGNETTSGVIIHMLCKKRRQLMEEQDKYGRTALHYTAMSGNIEAMRALKKEGCNLLAVDEYDQYTALHWAVVGGQAATLTELVSYGCSLQDVDKNGGTALHLAAEAAAIQLDEGAVDVRRHTGALECIQIVLANGLPIDIVDSLGQTPLHWALQHNNNLECVELLILNGADPNINNDEGVMGLHIAAKYGITEACQYLVESNGIHGNIEDSNGQTALFYSLLSQAIDCTKYLLGIGCSPTHRNTHQRSPAHIAASVGSIEGLQLLFQFNVDFNAKDDSKSSPLHDASANGHTDAVRFLLECGADPNVNGSTSEAPSPVHFAVSNGHYDCVKVLIEYECNLNAVLVTDEGQPLTAYDYAIDNPEMLELMKANDGKPGSEVYSPPSPVVPVNVTDDVSVDVPVDVDSSSAAVVDIPVKDPSTPSIYEDDERVEEVDVVKEVSKVKPARVPVSRPTSGAEVFDSVRPIAPPKHTQRKSSVFSMALDLIRHKSQPPPDSIRSSVMGLYAAHATMIAGAILGTPLGDKTVEIASKVATDTADELKKLSEDIDYEPGELEWLEEPEKEPTPTPSPSPVVPATPPSSPPPKVNVTMDSYQRRMRKAKAQMDETKSLGYRAVEELMRAQTTQAHLRRQFVMSSLKEEHENERKQFLNEEEKAREVSSNVLNRFERKMEEAANNSKELNEQIDKQLDEAHKQNMEITEAMTKLGINPRPTVNEWLNKKKEQRRIELQESLRDWERNKRQRQIAISMRQVLTTQRALRHVAWGVKKDLTAQVKAMDKDRHRTMSQPPLNTAGKCNRIPAIHSVHCTHYRKEQGQNDSQTKNRSKPLTSCGCVRATPIGFMKFRGEGNTPLKRRTSSDSTLWAMGRSYLAENDARFHKRVSHRAYGPKDVHADRTLTYLHPEEFNKLRRTSRTMNKTPLPYVNNEVA